MKKKIDKFNIYFLIEMRLKMRKLLKIINEGTKCLKS